ncbi:MAG TPA: sugar phosphate isomerase/epimerase family protein [Thermoclostridium sp.]|nr:sugar phosphate isomerase/epimerase family protein [Thermoclostridium sp.]
MRFGICTSIDNIESLEKWGYDYLEANISKIAQMEDMEFQETVKKAESSSIKVECFNILFPKTMDLLDPSSQWTPVSDYLHKAFERMKKLSGEIVVFGSGKCRAIPSCMTFAEGHHKLVDVIKKTGEIAQQYGITVVIEPLNTGETNSINCVAEGAMMVADVNLPNVGLLADGFHMFKENDNVKNITRVGKLRHTHVATVDGRKYPVKSDDLLEAFFKELKAINYNERMSIEGKAEDFEKDAIQALKVLKELDSK